MRIVFWSLLIMLLGTGASHSASLYLPLNNHPSLEHDIDRLLSITSAPSFKKPYTLDLVKRYLPHIKTSHPQLHRRIRQQLQKFSHELALTNANLQLSKGWGQQNVFNARGQRVADTFAGQVSGHAVINDYLIAAVGANYTTKNGVNPTNSYLSVGGDWLQVDIGLRERWFSSFTDSAMTMSTHAQVSPSMTFSNPVPLGDWRWQYEISYSELEQVDCIKPKGKACMQGRPELLNFTLNAMPVDWWQIGFARHLQFGGDGVDRSWSEVLLALVCPVCVQLNNNENPWGNQLMVISSQFNVNVGQPMSVAFEYGGEDTAGDSNFDFGNITMRASVFLPVFTDSSSLKVEWSSWQTGWYRHWMYRNGFTNFGNVMGHWGGDERYSIGEWTGGSSLSVMFKQRFSNHSQWFNTVRMLQNQQQFNQYHTGFELDSKYGFGGDWNHFYLGIHAGKNVFNEGYGRLYAQYIY
ncbi:capsule assembly Wzi family protein [Paraferrimonas sp. SM1919]|uniref:capsule assembly Wzi family protein n=1 Tax=Paraferrimonas sp. SM1919 TaxID=2662263 RepID=UPI0013D61099|nr:capsule assembly Wzi family protein [Paraferrimonas sp. SM1919]